MGFPLFEREIKDNPVYENLVFTQDPKKNRTPNVYFDPNINVNFMPQTYNL